MHDLTVLDGGPAGTSAAITAARAGAIKSDVNLLQIILRAPIQFLD
jgi:flavin-dependent dehydrogenase